MKASEAIAEYLSRHVGHCFGVTGGYICDIIDAISRQEGIEFIANHNEQASAYCADSYARLKGLGVVITTAGPGMANAVSGVMGAHVDSVPLLLLAGQVPTQHTRGANDICMGLRQRGFQEAAPKEMFNGVSSIALNSRTLSEVAGDIPQALHYATTGRNGAVVVSICDDLQHEEWTENWGAGGVPRAGTYVRTTEISTPFLSLIFEREFNKGVNALCVAAAKAKRPVLVIGAGYTGENLEALIDKLDWPVLLTWGALDKLDHNHPLNFRDFGITGNRSGNRIISDADFILALGTRLDTHERGADASKFCPNAEKWVVDIDEAELNKFDTSYHTIHGDCNKILEPLISSGTKCPESWRHWCETRRECDWADTSREEGENNPYKFLSELSEITPNDAIIISDAGQTVTWTMQAWKVKKGQRLFTQFNNSPMGYAVPASIGAHYAAPERAIICITGDGGLMMNVQELSTIARHNLTIKIFVLNNSGYGMIRGTQDMYLEGRHYGTWNGGVGDIVYMAEAFGIDGVDGVADNALDIAMNASKPILVDVPISPNSQIIPKVKFGEGLVNEGRADGEK